MAGGFLSIRSAMITLTLFSLVAVVAVCLGLAIDSGDRAMDKLSKSNQRALDATFALTSSATEAAFGVGDSSVKKLSQEYLLGTSDKLRSDLLNFFNNPVMLQRTLSTYVYGMGNEELNSPEGFRGLQDVLFPIVMNYQSRGYIIASAVVNAMGMGMWIVEDQLTGANPLATLQEFEMQADIDLKPGEKTHFHHIMFIYNNGTAGTPDLIANPDDADLRSANSRKSTAHWHLRGQPDPHTNNQPCSGPQGQAEQDEKLKWGYSQYDCPMALDPLEFGPFKLAMLPVVPANKQRWTNVYIISALLGMTLFTPVQPVDTATYSGPTHPNPAYQQSLTALWAGRWSKKGGMTGTGVTLFKISEMLRKIQVGDGTSRARMWTVVGTNWVYDFAVKATGMGIALPPKLQPDFVYDIGIMTGVSRGDIMIMHDCWDEVQQIMGYCPQMLNDTDAPDTIVANSARYMAQQPGRWEYFANITETDVHEYSVKHTETDNHEEVEEVFFMKVSRVNDGNGVDWWMTMVMDRNYVLGEIIRMRAETQETVVREKARTEAQVEDEKKKTEEELDNDRTILYIIVGVVTVAFMFASVVLVNMIVKPIRRLRDDMGQVAMMKLENVDPDQSLNSLAEVRAMQRSFTRMLTNMKELRNYMPQSLLMDDDGDDDDMDDPKGVMSNASRSRRSPGGAMETPGSQSGRGSRQGSRSARSRSQQSRQIKQSVAASSMASSQSAAMRAYLKKVAGQGLKKRRVTVLVMNVVEFHKECDGEQSALAVKHGGYLSACLDGTTKSKGIADGFAGDRMTCNFNAVKPLGTHRTACIQCADLSMRQGPLKLSVGAATGEAQCGNAGCEGLKKFCIFGSCNTFAYGLERIARRYGAVGVLCDKWIVEDAQNSYYMRSGGTVDFPKRTKKPIQISECKNAKTVSEDEWMYQMEEGASKDPYKSWNMCIEACIQNNWTEAETLAKQEDLARMLAEPGMGAWLQSMISSNTAPCTPLAFH